MSKIYITVDSGVVTSVVSDNADTQVILCDEDDYRAADDKERAEIEAVRQGIEDGVDKGTLFEVM